MTKKKKRTKFIKTFVHECDDFVITDDGTEYYPHADEWVRFRCDLPWLELRINTDLPAADFGTRVVQVLKRQIRDWNWTDDDEVPLPAPGGPGFEDALWSLSGDEKNYLRNHMWEPADLGEA